MNKQLQNKHELFLHIQVPGSMTLSRTEADVIQYMLVVRFGMLNPAFDAVVPTTGRLSLYRLLETS